MMRHPSIVKFHVTFSSREGGGVRPVYGKSKSAARSSFLRLNDVRRDQIIAIQKSKSK